MNIKILETKVQTIFENDLFAVTEENIKERILIELDFILQTIAEYYETILANVDAYQYINKLCYEYCEILKPYQKLKLVKNETSGVNDERTWSN